MTKFNVNPRYVKTQSKFYSSYVPGCWILGIWHKLQYYNNTPPVPDTQVTIKWVCG